MSRGMLALIAGLGNGYLQAKDRSRREGIEDERLQAEREDRAFNKSERDRLKKQRADMADAADPVTVQQSEQAGPVMPGAEGPAGQPLKSVYRVQGRAFETPELAASAAAAANTPQAVTARMADVAMRSGDPVKAQELRTGAMQEQAQQLQLSTAQRADINARFNDDLQKKVNSWDTLGQFISESAADGQDGALKVQAVVSPDGKTRVMNKVMPDGSLVPTGKVFNNTSDGLAQAVAALFRLPPEQKLNHLHQQAVLAQQAARDEETAKHHAGTLAETIRNNIEATKTANNNTAARIEMAQMRADSAAQGRELRAQLAAANGAKPAAQGMTFADLKDGHKGIASTLNADWKTQIESTTDPVALKALKVARENEISTVQRLYTGAMQSGFALTPEQAIVAFRSGDTATQEFKKRDGGRVKVSGVMYGGRFIPLSDNPGAIPETPSAPAAHAQSTKTPATPPSKPGMVDAAARAIRSALDSNAEQGRQMEAIRARVRESDSGGKALTMEERTTARKFGFVPIKG